jgi:glutamine synthetase
MDGSANPYLLQASVLAAGLDGLKNKIDPGKPLNCNMYEDHEKYPDLPKLPNELDQSLEKLKNNKDINDAFGKEVINSYIKLKNSEINQFKQKENFDKTKAITRWERDNTLDC